MSIRQKMAATPFAHMLGLSAKADDDESRKAKRAEDEEDKKARRAEEGDEDEDEKDKKAKRAEEDEGDEDSRRAEEGEDDEKDDEDKSKKGKKAKKAEDDDDSEGDDDDMKGSHASAAVRRDRARIAKIIAHGISNGCVRQAASLAVDTDMSAKVAIATLNASLADREDGGKSTLADRMAANPVPRIGLDGGKPVQSGLSPVAAAIVAAGEKARAGK